MIKAELDYLGKRNGMGEPDPNGSYAGIRMIDKGDPGNEPQSLEFLVPLHQLPQSSAVAELVAALDGLLKRHSTHQNSPIHQRARAALTRAKEAT